jgi:ABC-type sulfate transport system substrate-binding protein
MAGDSIELVVPSLSILAEPPVTVVDKNATTKETRLSPKPTSSFSTLMKRRSSSRRIFIVGET